MNNFYVDYCSGPSFVRFSEIQRVVRLIQTQSIVFFFFFEDRFLMLGLYRLGWVPFFLIKVALNRDIRRPSVDILVFLRF